MVAGLVALLQALDNEHADGKQGSISNVKSLNSHNSSCPLHTESMMPRKKYVIRDLSSPGTHITHQIPHDTCSLLIRLCCHTQQPST